MSQSQAIIENTGQVESIIEGFSLARLDRVISIRISFERSSEDRAQDVLTVTINSTVGAIGTGPNEYAVEFEFYNVRDLHLPPLGGSWFGLTDLDITDIRDRGMEDINLEVINRDNILFRCFCQHATMKKVFLFNGQEPNCVWDSEAG